MTKIDIFSGFLGAGKTTLIKKLIKEAYKNEKLVLIENEFGEIGIDGGFLKDAGVEITEMNSGCICCSLVGDFGKALKEVLERFHPDRILIEPSGVGKLSDVVRAVQNIGSDDILLNGFTTVVDAGKCKMYMKNFGEFFNDQVEHASSIILSHTDGISDEKLEKAVSLLKEHNSDATIVTTPWSQIDGSAILAAMEKKSTLDIELEKLREETEHEHEHECDHDHEHHHHDHAHHHEDECGCAHHHHHADEVFTSWGAETAQVYTRDELLSIVKALSADAALGQVLRAKGMLQGEDTWYYFDVTPGEYALREGAPDYTGRYCVIGAKLNEPALSKLFEKESGQAADPDWTIEVE